jgi:hypothetical protein
MKNLFEKLGIYINTYKISHGFNENGANANLLDIRNRVATQLFNLRKEGVAKPVKDFQRPTGEKAVGTTMVYNLIKKLESAKSADVSIPKSMNYPAPKNMEQVQQLLLRIKTDYAEYAEFFEKKSEYEKKLREYENYSSTKYIKASLSFKMMRKIENLLQLMKKNKEAPEEARSKAISDIFRSLEGGLSKPGKKEFIMRFSELHPIPEDEVGLIQLLNTIKLENKDTFPIFEEKEKIKHDALKFPSAIRAVVSYVLQEALYDIIGLAVKDARSNGKNSLSTENFRSTVINSSAFSALFFNLPVIKSADTYAERKAEYDQEVRELKETKGKKKKYLATKSFQEVEKSLGFLKISKTGKKIWEGLSVSADTDQHATTINKVFEKLKTAHKLKIKFSNKARELLILLVSQFLSTLATRFDIHRKHICKIEPTLRKTSKTRPEEKSIKFETVIEIFEIILCPKNDTINKVINTVCQFKAHFKKALTN